MIIVKLQGGLGNQMFQYAAACAVATQPGDIYLDLSFLKANQLNTDSFTARQYALEIFPNIETQFISSLLSVTLAGRNRFTHLLQRIFFPGIKRINDNTKFPEANKCNYYLDGYFQNEDIAQSIRKQLLHCFTFPQVNGLAAQIKKKITNTQNAISLHVRRGDYLKQTVAAYHGQLPIAYYKNAMAIVSKTVTNPHFFVFSDDIAWCRQYLSIDNVTITFVETNNLAWVDMALMTYCRHHIIANSSYSWWGAWLNPIEDKIVICPQNWVADDVQNLLTRSLIPANWTSI